MMQTNRLSRRRLLETTAAAITAGTLCSLLPSESLAMEDEKHPWIDAHSHIWTTDLKKYPLRNNQLHR